MLSRDFLIVGYFFLLFFDETFRKAIGSGGIYFTLVKDILLVVWLIAPLRLQRTDPALSLSLFFLFLLSFGSALSLFASGGSLVYFLAASKVYLVCLSGVALGTQLAFSAPFRLRVFRVIYLFAFSSSFVAIIQEHFRYTLPGFLQVNNFLTAHSASSAMYVEGTFGSPQTLSAVMVFVLFSAIFQVGMERRNSLFRVLIILLAAYTIYVARIRFSISFLAVSLTILFLYSFRNFSINRNVLLGFSVITLIFFAFMPGIIGSLDVEFFEDAFSASAAKERISGALLFILPDSDFLFGSGAGSTGRLSVLLREDLRGFNPYDSGVSHVFSQFGLVGILAIAILVFSVCLRLIPTLISLSFSSKEENIKGASFFLSIYFLALWLIKQDAALVNGATGLLMSVVLGMLTSRKQ